MKKLQIEDNFNRKVLSEGRNFGIGFSILKKINNFKFETLLPFSACKDYLNDIVYKTYYNSDLKFTVHGYDAKKIDCYNNKKYFYFGVNTLHYNKSTMLWNLYDEATTILINNVENLVKVINILEEHFNVNKSRTSFYKTTDNIIILKCPIFWLKKTYLISLLALTVRLYFNVKETDLKKGINIFTAKDIVPFIESDTYNMSLINNFLLHKLNKRKLFTDYPNEEIVKKSNYYAIHNAGIVAFTNHLMKLKHEKINNLT